MGQADYALVHQRQLELVAARRRGEIPDVLLLVEHSPVFTIGRTTRRVGGVLQPRLDYRSTRVKNLRYATSTPGEPATTVSRAALRYGGIPVVECERGGEVTYHGPGQLVGYPIIDLRIRDKDLHRYLRNIEETIIITLDNVGLRAQRRRGLTGVWVDGAKLASIGVAVRRWVTFHGFALNVTCNLEPFNWIVPCGLRGVKMTSVQQLQPDAADMHRIRELIADSFCTVFDLRGQPIAVELLDQFTR